MIKRMVAMQVLTFLLTMALSACGGGKQAGNKMEDGRAEGNLADVADKNPFPEELSEIPEAYYAEAKEQGTLVELEYETYESMSYEEKSQRITKRAIVYLPYSLLM